MSVEPMEDVEMNEDSSESGEGMDEDEITEQPEENEAEDDRPNVYLPGQPLKEGEELVCDQSAYVMLHQAQTGAPCLSFDIIRDNLGDNRQEFPLTSFIIAGTQAARTHANNVIVMKLSNLLKTNDEDDDDDDDDEESDEDDSKTPQMTSAMIKHLGCVNRIRATTCNGTALAATWSELGRVNIWNLSQQLEVVDSPVAAANYNRNNTGNTIEPLFTFSGHQQEGFAIDWCRTTPGVSLKCYDVVVKITDISA